MCMYVLCTLTFVTKLQNPDIHIYIYTYICVCIVLLQAYIRFFFIQLWYCVYLIRLCVQHTYLYAHSYPRSGIKFTLRQMLSMIKSMAIPQPPCSPPPSSLLLPACTTEYQRSSSRDYCWGETPPHLL